MITIAQWFSRVSQARQAMLDLLTSGVPQPDIGILVGAPAEGEPAAAGDPRAEADDYAYTSLAGLDNAATYTLPGGGALMAVGHLADAIRQAGGETAEAISSSALLALGFGPEEARSSAQQLGAGGALVVVQTDPVRETIVQGVFRHALNPILNGPRGPEGEAAEPASDDDAARQPPSTSVGALSSGTIPGGWGAAGRDLVEGPADENPNRPG